MWGELPEGWMRVSVAEVCGKPQYGLSHASSEEGNVAIVGMKDMDDGRVDASALVRTTVSAKEREAFGLTPGDLLLNRTNSPDLVGKLALWMQPAATEAVFASYLVRFPVDRKKAEPLFLLAALSTERARQMIGRLVTRGVSQANINPTAFSEEVEILCPPLPEQRRIVAVLDAWDRAIAATERVARLSWTRADGLRANLLGRRQQARAGDSQWKAHEFGAITREETRRNNGALGAERVMGVLKSEGLVPMRAHVMAADLTRYKSVPPTAFAYNPMRLNIGSIAMSAYEEDVLVSPDYVVFSVDDALADPRLIRHLTRTRAWSDHLARSGSGSVRTRIYYDDLAELVVFLPSRAEQTRIADILENADRTTEALVAKAALLRSQKRALMQRLLTGAQRLGDEFDAIGATSTAEAA